MSLRLAVLASGRGSNLCAVLNAINDGSLDASVIGVFSDCASAPALQTARESRIEARAFDAKAYTNRLEFDEAMFSAIDAVQPDLIVMAGYMRLVSDAAVTPRIGRMLNIHPSLLPAFKGLHTHRQALDAGATVHGASVHFVTAALDDGPVIAQARVAVTAGDTVESLGARVLEREHPLLVDTLRLFATGRLAWRREAIQLDHQLLASPMQLGDDDRLLAPNRISA